MAKNNRDMISIELRKYRVLYKTTRKCMRFEIKRLKTMKIRYPTQENKNEN